MRDLVAEALAGIRARVHRTLLTALGVVVGIAALVATLGLATTAGARIVSHFDELAATSVTVLPANDGGPERAQSPIPWDAPRRVERLNGVVAAGTMSTLDLPGTPVRATTVVDPLASDVTQPPLVSASPELLPAVRGRLLSGRWYDQGHSDRRDPVVVLGARLAARLHLADVSQAPAVFVGDRAFTVIGVLATVERAPSLLDAVILPDGTARARFGLVSPLSVVVETAVGAAASVAGQAPLALAPQQPEALVAQRPPEPAATRAKVAADTQALFLVLAAVTLAIGAVGIANTMLVSVLQRVGEIGLRRSLGATRGSVALLFMLESALVGLFGGVLGAALGVLTVVGVGYLRQWTPVMEPWLTPGAALLGAVVGLVAGIYPAWRASRIEPVAALRTDG
ncbi:ABC transporter permease [Micromonospora krabiensis]|uniref:Putative ABC transport system permease protein n=1 Tax=Micromonospora krabiensis TaxID=307121 RepID=A0A1C3NBN4_9ACTN|nr:ABC transporter permease [Micromonospora krabiensis]SBV29980.1 putative ABC transport system permease protein [Micromonospora krabiensis]